MSRRRSSAPLGPRLRRLLTHRVSRTAGNLYVVQGAALLVPLVTLPYLTRTLSHANLGLLLFAQAYASLATAFLQFGFDTATVRDVARDGDDRGAMRGLATGVVSAQVVLAGLIGIVSIALGAAIPLFRENPEYLAAAWGLSVAQGATPLWFFLGRQRLGALTALDLSGKVVAVAAIFLLVHQDEQGIRVLLIQAATTSAAVVGALVLLHRHTSFSRPRLALAAATLRANLQLALYRTSTTVGAFLPTLVIGLLAVPAQIGYYGVAEKLQKAPVTVLWPLSQALYPSINRTLSTNPLRARQVVRWSALLFVALGLAMGLALFALAPWLIPLVFGPGYDSAVPVFRVLALSIPFALGAHVFAYQVLMPLRQDRVLNVVSWLAFALRLLLAIPLTAAYGAIGMAWAVLIAAIANAAAIGVASGRSAGFHRDVVSAEAEHAVSSP